MKLFAPGVEKMTELTQRDIEVIAQELKGTADFAEYSTEVE